jgi:hypothetical protein
MDKETQEEIKSNATERQGVVPYIKPAVEVIEMEHQGVLAASGAGQDFVNPSKGGRIF